MHRYQVGIIGCGVISRTYEEHPMLREPYTRYLGKPITDTPMKVKSVLTENFWFEIIQPLGDHDPWAQWLKDHGTSICSICLVTNGLLEDDERKTAWRDTGRSSSRKKATRHTNTLIPPRIWARCWR